MRIELFLCIFGLKITSGTRVKSVDSKSALTPGPGS